MMTFDNGGQRPWTEQDTRVLLKGCGNVLVGCAALVGLTAAGVGGGVAGAEWAGAHVSGIQDAFATGFLAHAGIDLGAGVLGGALGLGVGVGALRAVGAAGRMVSRNR